MATQWKKLWCVIYIVSDSSNAGQSVTDKVLSCKKQKTLKPHLFRFYVHRKKWFKKNVSKHYEACWWKRYLLMWCKDECCYLAFSTQFISQCIYSPHSHPPDLSSSHFLHSPGTHTNFYPSQDSAQSVLYLTLIKPFFSLHFLERLEWLFSVELTPSTFPVRAETFPQAECVVLQKRALAWRKLLQTKQKLSFNLLNSE